MRDDRADNLSGGSQNTDTIEVFSSKAETYARYRWDYAPQAIETIFDVTRISRRTCVADIGAGTGILTKHFVGKVKRVFAVEPNEAMRQIAKRTLESQPSCQIVNGRAEATTLPDHSVDLIAVAQAFNWFDPQPTRTELLRILKPGGWLATLRNYGTDKELARALKKIYPKESDTWSLMPGKDTPMSFYYGNEDYLKQTFVFTVERTWNEFMGTSSSASYAPDENSPLYADFERAARRVFERFSRDGLVVLHAVTELCLGQVKQKVPHSTESAR
jgi:ubiquinone/menaquinone biosynthesis C-methylase UbiE